MKNSNFADYSNILDFLLDAICVVDHATGCFVSVSGACERIFGYTPEEMIGKPMIDFVFHEDRQRTLEAAARVQAGYLQLHFENRYVRKDGEIVHINWSARWSEADQRRIAVARDITERKRLEAMQALPQDAPEIVKHWQLSTAPPRLMPPGFPPIPLSAQDLTVMLALAANGEAVSRKKIVLALGEDFLEYDQRRLDTQMRRLRRKVEQACGLQLPVTTLRGIGYRFYEEIKVTHRPLASGVSPLSA
ncbi:PAS domain S-box protein [Pseudomonas stutzeri]|nr:PAS domain S-box protein [Stutzerimonas stutzeri]